MQVYKAYPALCGDAVARIGMHIPALCAHRESPAVVLFALCRVALLRQHLQANVHIAQHILIRAFHSMKKLHVAVSGAPACADASASAVQFGSVEKGTVLRLIHCGTAQVASPP